MKQNRKMIIAVAVIIVLSTVIQFVFFFGQSIIDSINKQEKPPKPTQYFIEVRVDNHTSRSLKKVVFGSLLEPNNPSIIGEWNSERPNAEMPTFWVTDTEGIEQFSFWVSYTGDEDLFLTAETDDGFGKLRFDLEDKSATYQPQQAVFSVTEEGTGTLTIARTDFPGLSEPDPSI